MMENLITTQYDKSEICIGNNEFETNVITLAAGASILEGDMLKRDASTKKFIRVTDTDTETPVALSPLSETNSGGTSIDVPVRAIVGGKVRSGKVLVAGAVATLVQLDMIRSYGIIPVPVTDVSQADNQ